MVGAEIARQLVRDALERRKIAAATDESYSSSFSLYIACPSHLRDQADELVKDLQEYGETPSQSKNSRSIKIVSVSFDTFGGKERVRASAQGVCDAIKKSNSSSTQPTVSAKQLTGVVFNPYGAGSDNEGVPRPDSRLLEIAELKVVGNNILLEILMEEGLIREGSRVVYSTSEAARGLPKMGIPVPVLSKTKESFVSHLDGTAYSKHYQWEHPYAYCSQINVLYMMAMASKHRKIYFSSISPGMTQESFNTDNVPSPTIVFRAKMFAYLYLMFPLLQRWEIAQDYRKAAKLFISCLLSKEEWEFQQSGTFVAAKSGTGGPVCDQTELEAGKVFCDRELQDLAYNTIREYII